MLRVDSPNVVYTEDEIISQYSYAKTRVSVDDATGKVHAVPTTTDYEIVTNVVVPRVGVLFVGWGGNNGATLTAGIIANRRSLSWRTKEGVCHANYIGSLTQSSTILIGSRDDGSECYLPMAQALPMVNPNDLVVGGWDISGVNMAEAMERAQVLDIDLQRQLYDEMVTMKPMRSIYYPDFIAANQAERADNVLPGAHACAEHLEVIRQDIRQFKADNGLDKVIVLWTANTERFCDELRGVHDTGDGLLAAIKDGNSEVSPSTVFACAAILEGSSFINGSPQNTIVPGVVDLAQRHGVFVAGDDFKTGQTKIKSVIVDFLVAAGIAPRSIVSYNHLGNNDGRNLSAQAQFRSKEISKSSVVDDMVASNSILYPDGKGPDHCVVIKYVPYVQDSKRALDEYVSEIFMGGKNTIAMHNTCEDSLLAAPLILDLIILMELFQRIRFTVKDAGEQQAMHPVLSILSYLLKAPVVPEGTPVVNALFKQRGAIENLLRACVGLPPVNYMMLEHKLAKRKH